MVTLGVSSKHIQGLKKELLEPNIYQYFYDLTNNDESMELVPTKNIVSLGLRGESNQTWWDHAIYKVGTLEEYRMDRFERKNNFINLNKVYQIFTNDDFADRKDAVRLIYYPEDNKYFVINGNHRVTWAKLLNAPGIKAKVVRYSLNHDKRSNYLLYSDAKELLLEVIKLNNMRYDYKKNEIYVFLNKNLIARHSLVKDFSNNDVINKEVKKINHTIEDIRKLKADVDFYQRFPKKISKFIINTYIIFSDKKNHWKIVKEQI